MYAAHSPECFYDEWLIIISFSLCGYVSIYVHIVTILVTVHMCIYVSVLLQCASIFITYNIVLQMRIFSCVMIFYNCNCVYFIIFLLNWHWYHKSPKINYWKMRYRLVSCFCFAFYFPFINQIKISSLFTQLLFVKFNKLSSIKYCTRVRRYSIFYMIEYITKLMIYLSFLLCMKCGT